MKQRFEKKGLSPSSCEKWNEREAMDDNNNNNKNNNNKIVCHCRNDHEGFGRKLVALKL